MQYFHIKKNIKKEKKTKKIFDWVEKSFLQNFKLSSKHQEPNTDWLRMLHISDAYPIGNVQTILIPVNILKKEKNQFKFKEKNQSYTTIWVECIPEGTILEFEIMWDTTLMKKFSNYHVNLPRNIDDVISAIQSFSSDIIDYETKFLEGENNLRIWYSQTKPNFRFGFGSGMISTTVIMLLNEELRKI
jgi:CRISPR-associated protein Csm5